MTTDTPPRETAIIESYHAHVYYDEASRSTAEWLREELGARFEVELGRWHDKLVGPHPRSMYQVAFDATEFARIVPWLMINRRGLIVLVHPNTGDAVEDHETNPLWLGEKLELDIEFLRRFEAEQAERARAAQ